MADTTNLSKFLEDVADAIRTKRETTDKIPAEQFDQEILSIETGIDTSDATALAVDIISPKTAYVNGEKITGAILPTYDEASSVLNAYSVVQSGTGTGDITSDGKAIILWKNNVIYTYVYNESTQQYDFKNQYTQTALGMGSNDGSVYAMAVSGYIEDRICRVAFSNANQSLVCVTFNADTGEMLYTANGKYTAKLNWPGVYNNSHPWRNYIEPVYSMVFNRRNPRVLYMSYNNGFSKLYTTSSVIEDTKWSFGADLGLGQCSDLRMSADNLYLLGNNKLVVLSSNGISAAATYNFGTNASINTDMSMAVSNATLYKVVHDGTKPVLSEILSTNVTIKSGLGTWLSQKQYAVVNSNTLYVYDFTDVNAVKTQTYSQNAITYRHPGVSLALHTTGNNRVLKVIVENRLSSLQTSQVKLYATADADVSAEDIVSGKIAYSNDGKIVGTVQEVKSGSQTGVGKLRGFYDHSAITGKVQVTTDTEYEKLYRVGSILAQDIPAETVAQKIGLTPDKLVKGSTVLGIEGTAEAGGGTVTVNGVKLFETVEEMNADETAEEGDLAIVYRNEVQNMTATKHAQVFTFPATVVLPTAVTSSAYCMFRGENGDAEGQVNLSKSSCRITIYTSSKSYSVSYTSTNGLTYKRSTSVETIDCGEPIYCYYEDEWVDSIGYFMQVGGDTFDGLFEYGPFYDKSYFGTLPIEGLDTTNKTYEGSITNQYNSAAVFEIINKMINDLGLTATSSAFAFATIDSKPHLIYTHRLDNHQSKLLRLTYNTLTASYGINTYWSQEQNVYISELDLENKTYQVVKSLENSSSPEFIGDIGNVQSLFTSISYDAGTFSINNDANEVYSYDGTKFSVLVNVNSMHVTPYYLVNGYLIADTQFSVANANDLLPGKTAYGKNGVITGDGSIYNVLDTKSVADMLGMNELYSASSYFSNFKIDTIKNKLYSVVEDNTSDYVFNYPYHVKELGYPTSTDYFKNLLNLQYINPFAVFSLNDFYTGMLAICSATSTSVTSGGDLIYVIFDPDFNIVKTETIVANIAISSTSMTKEICYSPTDCYVTFKSPFDKYQIFTFKFDMANKTLSDYTLYNSYSTGTVSGSYIRTVYHNNYLYVARSIQYDSSTYYLYITKFNPDLTVVKNISRNVSSVNDLRLTEYAVLDGNLYLHTHGYGSSKYHNTVVKIEDTINTLVSDTTSTSLFDGILTDGEYLYVGCDEGTKKYNANLQLVETLPIKSKYYGNTKYFNFNITDYANYTCESFQRRLSVVDGKVQDTTYYDPSNPFMDTKKDADLYIVGSIHMNSDVRIVNKREIGKSSISKSAWLTLAPKKNASFKEGLDNNAYMVGISDGERIYYTGKFDGNAMRDYTGMKSPAEYNTAIDTANQILGEGV